MKWKEGCPTVAGWYWKRSKGDDEPVVVKVREYDGGMCVGNWRVPTGVIWAGPIQAPIYGGEDVEKK